MRFCVRAYRHDRWMAASAAATGSTRNRRGGVLDSLICWCTSLLLRRNANKRSNAQEAGFCGFTPCLERQASPLAPCCTQEIPSIGLRASPPAVGGAAVTAAAAAEAPAPASLLPQDPSPCLCAAGTSPGTSLRESSYLRSMPLYSCCTCAAQFAEAAAPPAACPICTDDRQYVAPGGQVWATREELRERHRNTLKEVEPGVLAIGVEPKLAIGQQVGATWVPAVAGGQRCTCVSCPLCLQSVQSSFKAARSVARPATIAPTSPLPQAYLIQAPGGNVLWDCLGVCHPGIVADIQAAGGISAIVISHPHFYCACVDWAEEFDCKVGRCEQLPAGLVQLPSCCRLSQPGRSCLQLPSALAPSAGVSARRRPAVGDAPQPPPGVLGGR